jgi:hypothetical protein
MKKISQVEILHWAKTKHGVNPKYVRQNLKDEDFVLLCSILYKTKQLGSVISAKEVVDEFISDRGIEYIPQPFSGESVDLIPLFNTHPQDDQGFIDVSLAHVLLHQWCRPTRENRRTLKKHLKELGYEVYDKIAVHTKTLELEPYLKLKQNYPLSLPSTIKRYTKPVKWYKKVSNWIYLDQPKVTLKDEPYEIKDLGERWEAYFTQRFIELFTMSELTYIHQHPQIRGCYENAPPVLSLCDLTLRDVFKRSTLKNWVDTLLKHTKLELYQEEVNSQLGQTFLDTVCDEVEGRLSKTTVSGRKVEDLKTLEGWTSIIVICYVNDALNEYQRLL